MGKEPLIGSIDHINEVSKMIGGVETITAAKTLTIADSGKTFIFDVASGATVTLPTAYDGCRFKFLFKTAVTSNNYGIDTAAATSLFYGRIVIHDKDVSTYDSTLAHFAADQSNDDSIDMNGSTTGGLPGGYIDLVAYGGHWFVDGEIYGDGNLANPFS